ncbi:MAG: long-chain fatty acid--CoA ligase [Deltaproteobacteria bacterium]|nr:long-chain fatty acid--CoA ligase [Deltaproteobacteria bacterium]
MAQTVPLMVFSKGESSPTKPALRQKVDGRYQDISWQDMIDKIKNFGAALLALGLTPGDRVAIMAPNGPNWVAADLGAMAAGGVTVPIYQTETVENLVEILKDSGSRFLFVQSVFSDQGVLDRLDQLPDLKTVILFYGQEDQKHFMSIDDFLASAKDRHAEQLQQTLSARQGSDMATLVYTSGTTGQHKGVILTHDNILSSVKDAVEVFDIGPDDVCLSFLPLSHVFERVDGYYLMLHQKAIIAYAESIDTVPLNLAEVKPTVVISVPRLYEKMYERVLEQVNTSSWLKKQIFFGALEIGQAFTSAVMAGHAPSIFLRCAAAIARPVAFSRLRQRLGGCLRYFISGGAPLTREVAELFFAADIPIYEGYGLTESTSGIAANTPAHFRIGTVGQLFPSTRARIAGDGEILLKGPTMSTGYWNRPEQTRETFSGGWLKTGDIGEIDEDGFLKITDRKKDLIITAGGENIAPQELEHRFKGNRYLSNAIIFGDQKPFLTALLVPNFDALEKYARQHRINFLNHCDLVTHPVVLSLYRRHVDRMQQDLPSFNKVKRFTLLSRDFSSERGEMTPTLKLKRRNVASNFESVIASMYRDRDHGVHDSGFCIVDDE